MSNLPNNIYIEPDLQSFLESTITMLLIMDQYEGVNIDSKVYIGKEYNILTLDVYEKRDTIRNKDIS